MSARIVGLDLSITATGVAQPDRTLTVWRTHTKGDARLVELADHLEQLVADGPLDLAVIEDLPTHAHGAGITGMVHGAVRTVLLRHHIPYALVAPASLKKYATGTGNAPKPEMRMQLYKRIGVDEPDDNAVDAAWLWLMGVDHVYGRPAVSVPAMHRVALEKVVWPDA